MARYKEADAVNRIAVGLVCILFVLLITAVVGSAQTVAGPKPANDPTTDYRIGSEDTIQITVWKNDALSRTVPVRPDGKISLPLLNDLQVAGLTPMELRDVLTDKIKEYQPAPEVSVIVLEPRSFRVSIIGEVPRPTRLELRSKTTVLDLLAMVGGVTQFASKRNIRVMRRDAAGVLKSIPFNYNKALAGDPDQENFYLQPNDVVVVP